MIAQKTSEVILQLKEIRNAKGYSCQKVCDMVEASGGYVSLATIKRVFADGSEEKNFRYEDSIRPIAIALIGADPTEPLDGEAMSVSEIETNALRKIALLKEDMIQELRTENQQMQETYDQRIKYIIAESDKKTAHIAALTDQINRKERLVLSLAAGLIGLLVLNCIVLVIDVLHSDIGFVRGIVGRPAAIIAIIVVSVLIVIMYFFTRRMIKKSGKQPDDESGETQ